MSSYRVLRIVHRMSISGPTYHVAYLTKLLGSKFETLLVSGMVESSEMDGTFIMDEIGVKPRYMSKMQRNISLKTDYESYLELRNIIREFKPHIVHTHAAKSGALGRLASIHENVPVILHTFHGHVFHSYFSRLKTQLFLQIERYLAKKCACIVAISSQQKDELSKIFKICPRDKIKVIPLGLDLEKFRVNKLEKRKTFRDEFGLNEEEIAIGIIGRVTEIKNHAHFLKSFSKLATSTNKTVKGFVIGDGNLLQESKNLAKTLGLRISDDAYPDQKADIYFTSWRVDIDTIMNGLDILALTSLNEGTPVSLIEAQAAQKPIVSTNVGGVIDVVRVNETALLSGKDDVDSFSENLLRMVNDPELRQILGNNGSFVFDKFSCQRLVDDIEELYHKLLLEKMVSDEIIMSNPQSGLLSE